MDLRPFRALRPVPELAARVAAPPYDVVDVAEARAQAGGNPESFLHVSRPEIDLPDEVDPHADVVHRAGRQALDALVDRGVLRLDDTASYYVYRQYRGQHVQTGIVGCATVADYASGAIRTHEHTRPDKEDDRVRHLDALDAHDEPVFLFAPPDDEGWAPIAAVVAEVVVAPPLYDLTRDDGTRQLLWPVTEWAATSTVEAAFAKLPLVYLADGHHRSAAAARLAALRPGQSGAEEFPVVVFPGEELQVLAYHRVVADLGGHTLADLLTGLAEHFEVAPVPDGAGPSGVAEPARRQEFAMYCAGSWFRLRLRAGSEAGGPVASLDVSALQNLVLAPLLGILDPRTDQRIGFVGGARGLGELQRLVDAGTWAVAFALYPTSVAELVAVAAAGDVMPPKSTWFEPKLLSGLFVHPIAKR